MTVSAGSPVHLADNGQVEVATAFLSTLRLYSGNLAGISQASVTSLDDSVAVTSTTPPLGGINPGLLLWKSPGYSVGLTAVQNASNNYIGAYIHNQYWQSLSDCVYPGGTPVTAYSQLTCNPFSIYKGVSTPASATATCSAGQTSSDASYFYFCTAANTWKRVAISSF